MCFCELGVIFSVCATATGATGSWGGKYGVYVCSVANGDDILGYAFAGLCDAFLYEFVEFVDFVVHGVSFAGKVGAFIPAALMASAHDSYVPLGGKSSAQYVARCEALQASLRSIPSAREE